MKLVLASNNAHKLTELECLLAPLGLSLVSQGSLGIPEADEPHLTFVENALTKARHAAQASACAAIADDSGLCVDALAGAPGVLSARYATLFGQAKSDEANNMVLLQKMSGQSQRSARFICALVAVRAADDPEPLIAVGRWHAELLTSPRGQGGFGYDPLVFIPGLGSSVAELAPEKKNQHSHRAKAMQQMLQLMREVWQLG
ncbi:MAG: RdgB/HAM1 family non-canonical purine NTP pyrophosphatase [Burkholderiales bacterium]